MNRLRQMDRKELEEELARLRERNDKVASSGVYDEHFDAKIALVEAELASRGGEVEK